MAVCTAAIFAHSVLTAETFCHALQVSPAAHCAFLAQSCEAFFTLSEKHHPSLLMYIIDNPQLDAVGEITLIKKRIPKLTIIVCSLVVDPVLLQMVLRTGINALLPPTTTFSKLIDTIRLVTAGNVVIDETMELLLTQTSIKPESSLHPALTKKQRIVLRLFADGLSGNEIASRLKLSVYTIENYRKLLLKKFGFKKMVLLVQFARQNHII